MEDRDINPYEPPRTMSGAERDAECEPFADRLPRALLQGCLYGAIGLGCGMIATFIALRMADEGVEDVGFNIIELGMEFSFLIGFLWGGGMCVRRLLNSLPRPPISGP